jgi:hypothetical protein
VLAADTAAVVIVVVMTGLVVVAVIGLHVWGAIQDGREEKANWRRRHPDGDSGAERERRDSNPRPPA